MNIFVLDTNPVTAARMQCDKHVVKMVLETAQILSTVAGGPYKPTHANHPCVLWAGRSVVNFNWLLQHGRALCEEYTLRYGRRHKCQDVIELINSQPIKLPPFRYCEFVQCMPEELRMSDPVDAYRKYYHTKTFAQWNRGRPAPYWWEGESK
jgi:hypothetical protein